ncbi:MAG TPA: carboxyl transferase domain-containing protein [Terriglobales bacterium]
MFAKHRATWFGMAGKDVPADGVVTGCARIDGRTVHLVSQDFTVPGALRGSALRQDGRYDAALSENRQPVHLH